MTLIKKFLEESFQVALAVAYLAPAGISVQPCLGHATALHVYSASTAPPVGLPLVLGGCRIQELQGQESFHTEFRKRPPIHSLLVRGIWAIDAEVKLSRGQLPAWRKLRQCEALAVVFSLVDRASQPSQQGWPSPGHLLQLHSGPQPSSGFLRSEQSSS